MSGAYEEIYLDDCMENLGEMIDYAVNACGFECDKYWELFLASGIAGEIGTGNPAYLCGRSGTELVMEVLAKTGYETDYPPVQIEYERSPEYWSGWILAYYQWFSKRSFKEIHEYLSMGEVCEMYPVYHEMAEQQFADAVDVMIGQKTDTTRLQMIRRLRGYSQRVLAEKAGVNLRTLQQYEIGSKDIRKAAAGSLKAMAKALDCEMAELLEK